MKKFKSRVKDIPVGYKALNYNVSSIGASVLTPVSVIVSLVVVGMLKPMFAPVMCSSLNYVTLEGHMSYPYSSQLS